MSSTEKLRIYKASAGSGKTFTLTKEYIRMLLENPEDEYRHTLAVTFTNKATEEMKERIIKELHTLASDCRRSAYYNEFIALPGIAGEPDPQETLTGRSRTILIRILNDYSSFNVSTIDKFFQGIMRTFAKEFGHQYSYNVELDTDSVIEAAVDRMYASLEDDSNRTLLDWLVKYSLDRIENGKGWKVKEEITKTAVVLLSENFSLDSNHDETPAQRMVRIEELQRSFRKCRKDFNGRAVELARRGLELMNGFNLSPESFKNGSRSPFKFYDKIINAGMRHSMPAMSDSFVKLGDNTDGWGAKGKDFSAIANAGLMQNVKDIIALFRNDYAIYNTAVMLEKNVYVWGLLGMVRNFISEYCIEKNIILLPESTKLLNAIIDGDQTPFIYERVGTYLKHFLLDEFQDTSNLQWRNFIPLLHESLANGNSNLIVGDVKQSIYRWRNSNWKILGQEVQELFGMHGKDETLEYNFRTLGNIIAFNNEFYKYFAANIGNEDSERIIDIESLYSDCTQKLSDNLSGRKEKGYVEVSYCPVLDTLVEKVKFLCTNGYLPSQIGILTRTNAQGEEIAARLMQEGMSVATVDTLTLGSNGAVSAVIDYLKEIDQSNDICRQAHRLLSGIEGSRLLSEEEMERYASLSLYQMAETIIREKLGNSAKDNSQFLCSLLDSILEYSRNNGASLPAFLKWWNDTGSSQKISSASDRNAVNILTVHKSKGLEFEAVIIPYFEFKSGHSSKELWSSSANAAFGYDLPMNVSISKALKESLFRNDYENECAESLVDNINIAYVAFTRAKSALYVLAEEDSKDILLSFIQNTQSLNDPCGIKCGFNYSEDAQMSVKSYSYGQLCGPMEAEKKHGSLSLKLENAFCQKLDPSRTVTALTDSYINDNELSIRDKGILLHDAFARIQYTDDIERIEDSELREKIRSYMNQVRDYGWFWNKNEHASGLKVLNETGITAPDGSLCRPDRMILKDNGNGALEATVIDYKFGKAGNSIFKYRRQVKGYMELLEQMGCTAVKGYIWYVGCEVEEVR